MKNLYLHIVLFVLCILFTTTSQAKDYYISATGSDANNGLTPSTAWKTLTKLNASFATIVAGDVIMFKSGETFYGTLKPTKSDITFSSYGTGAKPVLSGLTTVSSWTSLGGNIWEATVAGGLTTLNMVIINGVITPMGRFPNANSTLGGYLTYESAVSPTATSQAGSVTDNQLAATTNWTGADILVRKVNFTTVRTTITSHVGTKLSFNLANGSAFVAGMGYFIENHLATLDQNGEWYYDPATRKIKIFYTTPPPSIQVPTLNNLINMSFSGGTGIRSNILFNNISLKGSEQHAVYLMYGKNVRFTNCDFQYICDAAIYNKYNVALSVTGCNFRDIYMAGIQDYGSPTVGSDILVTNSTFRNIGMQPGMISKTPDNEIVSGNAISLYAANSLIKDNIFDSIGYCAVRIVNNRENQIVRRNIISNFCAVKNDGGAIYNNGWRGNPAITGYTIIDSNIVFKSLDASNGTERVGLGHARGIYLDATSTRVKVLHNTIFDVWDGIYLSQAQQCTVRDNSLYNIGGYGTGVPYAHAAIYTNDVNVGFQHTINNVITANILFAKFPKQMQFYSANNFGGFGNLGVLDSNYYVNTSTGTNPLFLANNGSSASSFLLPSWKSLYSAYDSHSFITPVVTPVLTDANVDSYLLFEYNATASPKTVSFPGLSKKDAKGKVYNNSAVIPAFSSLALIAAGTVNIFPVSNAGADKIITLPVNTTTLSGSGTDTDGTVINYKWTKVAGPSAFAIASPASAVTNINNMIAGIYQFELAVTDNNSAVKKDTVQVTVDPALNIFPAANAATDQSIILPVSSTILSGSGKDADGTISSYAWVKIAGPLAGLIETPGAASTPVTGLEEGIYRYELTVTYNSGATGKDTVQVTVIAAINRAPLSNAGPDSILSLPVSTTILNGTGTDTDGTIASYSWVKISGPSGGTIANPTSAITLVDSLAEGVYMFELTVKDNKAAEGKDTVQLTVTGIANRAPVVKAGRDISIKAPANKASLAGMAIEEDGTITSYKWVKISGPESGKIANEDSTTASLFKLVLGIYQFELTVTDNHGATGKDTVRVTVSKESVKAPVAKAGNNRVITLPTNTTVLTGNAETGTEVAGIEWVQLSGPSTGTLTAPQLYSTAVSNLVEGLYQYELTVTDPTGAISKDTVEVKVNRAVINTLAFTNAAPARGNELKVYPNPVQDRANLHIISNGSKAVSVVVADLSGRILKSNGGANLNAGGTDTLDTSSLQDGYYIITVRFDDGQSLTKKIVKHSGK